jgi:hypothetical protein
MLGLLWNSVNKSLIYCGKVVIVCLGCSSSVPCVCRLLCFQICYFYSHSDVIKAVDHLEAASSDTDVLEYA